MHIEVEIVTPQTGAREKDVCWETSTPHVYQTIIGSQVINVYVDRQNVCDMPVPMKGGLMLRPSEMQSKRKPDRL